MIGPNLYRVSGRRGIPTLAIDEKETSNALTVVDCGVIESPWNRSAHHIHTKQKSSKKLWNRFVTHGQQLKLVRGVPRCG